MVQATVEKQKHGKAQQLSIQLKSKDIVLLYIMRLCWDAASLMYPAVQKANRCLLVDFLW